MVITGKAMATDKITESWVKEKVKVLFKRYRVWYFMPSMGQYGRAGIGDFIACVRGRLLMVETKAGQNRPTTLQEIEIGRVNGAGGVAIVVNENRLESFEKLLQVMCEQPDISGCSLKIEENFI
ncbi:MAG: hypothetical protein ACREQ5_11205 [Candidatus Dormibacteria bacterium]